MDASFILDFQKNHYPYMEEVNEGIIKQVESNGQGASILDVGAGRGTLGEALRAKNFEVWAIEENETAATEASTKVNNIICSDLHDMDKVIHHLNGKKFQYIIFSDVLEHVFDPLQVIRNYLPFLEDNGKILISLPNTVNWLNRLRFLVGIFNYEMTGVMDRTHVRFFTFKSAKKLLEASQCMIEKVDSTPFILRACLPVIKKFFYKSGDRHYAKRIIESSNYTLYKKYIYPLEYFITKLMPSLFAFRIILVGRKQQ